MVDSVTTTWERQPGETPKAYAAFCVYRDQGPYRSLRKTAEQFYAGKNTVDHRQIERWSSKNRWVQRAAAFDVEQDRINQQKRQEAAEEARERVLQGSRLVQSIAMKGFQQILNGERMNKYGQIRQAEENPSKTLLRYWREGVEMEFVALGLPINVVREQVDGASPEGIERDRRLDGYRRVREAMR
jgi:hypothetical protein